MKRKQATLLVYAYEVMHGAHLCDELLTSAMLSARPALRRKYPDLAASIDAAQEALFGLYQEAGRAWDREASGK